jgi:hypothetical protein
MKPSSKNLKVLEIYRIMMFVPEDYGTKIRRNLGPYLAVDMTT